MHSQALEGRHNIAQLSPQRATSHSTGHAPCPHPISPPPPSPSTRQRRVEGEGKRHLEIGLTPYPELCRPSRAIHLRGKGHGARYFGSLFMVDEPVPDDSNLLCKFYAHMFSQPTTYSEQSVEHNIRFPIFNTGNITFLSANP